MAASECRMAGPGLAMALLAILGGAQAGTPGCGRTKLTGLPGGPPGAAGRGSFPSMCSLFVDRAGARVFMGGASIVQTNQLVTLATLVEPVLHKEEEECGEGRAPFQSLMVICGALNLQQAQRAGAQERPVARVFLHPGYSNSSLINNVAILLLDEPLTFSKTVAQVCLPRPSEGPSKDEHCVAVGHGKDGDDGDGFSDPIYSPTLQWVSLPVWGHADCEAMLNSVHFTEKHGINWTKDPSHLCAGGEEGRDTCRGDGGGPFICEEGGRGEGESQAAEIEGAIFGGGEEEEVEGDIGLFDLRTNGGLRLVQAGVTAWGIGCGQAGVPAVYSDLASAACWLDQVMSCHPAEAPENNDILGDVNLRTSEGGPSVGGLTSAECGEWLRNIECGCSQKLVEDAPVKEDTVDVEDFQLRGISELDLS